MVFRFCHRRQECKKVVGKERVWNHAGKGEMSWREEKIHTAEIHSSYAASEGPDSAVVYLVHDQSRF